MEEAYELVEEIVRKLKWKVAASDPPTVKPLKGGQLEATDLTPVIGFPDDIDRARRGQRHACAHRRALRLALRPC